MTLKYYKKLLGSDDENLITSEISSNLVSWIIRIEFKHFEFKLIQLKWYRITVWKGKFDLTYIGELENKFLRQKSLLEWMEKNRVPLYPL